MSNTTIDPIPCQVETILYHRPPPPPEIRTYLSFEIPTSELRDFEAYKDFLRGQIWKHEPFDYLSSLIVQVESSIHKNASSAFNRPNVLGIPSMKTIVSRTLKLMKSEPTLTLKIEVTLPIVEKLKALAEQYGISLGETCVGAIGYHAAVWRQHAENIRPKTPIDRFERSLRIGSRPARATAAR